MSTPQPFGEAFSTSDAYNTLVDQLYNLEDILLLHRLFSQSHTSTEPALEAMVKFAIAKAQDSTQTWRTEVPTNGQDSPARLSTQEPPPRDFGALFSLNDVYGTLSSHLHCPEDITLLNTLRLRSVGSPNPDVEAVVGFTLAKARESTKRFLEEMGAVQTARPLCERLVVRSRRGWGGVLDCWR